MMDLNFWNDREYWAAIGTTSNKVRRCFEEALENAGLNTYTLSDFGRHNVMFDRYNRPTWYDFSHGSDGNKDRVLSLDPKTATIPEWDEKAERAKLAERFKSRVLTKAA
jgi:hypothetical protein